MANVQIYTVQCSSYTS